MFLVVQRGPYVLRIVTVYIDIDKRAQEGVDCNYVPTAFEQAFAWADEYHLADMLIGHLHPVCGHTLAEASQYVRL